MLFLKLWETGLCFKGVLVACGVVGFIVVLMSQDIEFCRVETANGSSRTQERPFTIQYIPPIANVKEIVVVNVTALTLGG